MAKAEGQAGDSPKAPDLQRVREVHKATKAFDPELADGEEGGQGDEQGPDARGSWRT